MAHQPTAKWLILAGAVLLLIGVLYYVKPNIFSWFGRLPGDIRIERENTRVFIPITTMILISVVGSVLLNVIKRFF